jgi:hypothetical protein
MAKPALRRPLEELNAYDNQGLEPSTPFHPISSDAFTPAAARPLS